MIFTKADLLVYAASLNSASKRMFTWDRQLAYTVSVAGLESSPRDELNISVRSLKNVNRKAENSYTAKFTGTEKSRNTFHNMKFGTYCYC